MAIILKPIKEHYIEQLNIFEQEAINTNKKAKELYDNIKIKCSLVNKYLIEAKKQIDVFKNEETIAKR